MESDTAGPTRAVAFKLHYNPLGRLVLTDGSGREHIDVEPIRLSHLRPRTGRFHLRPHRAGAVLDRPPVRSADGRSFGAARRS